MILPKIRDKRFITFRHGGTLTDENHRLLAVWAAECATHVLHYFEDVHPDDNRPRRAIEAAHASRLAKVLCDVIHRGCSELHNCEKETVIFQKQDGQQGVCQMSLSQKTYKYRVEYIKRGIRQRTRLRAMNRKRLLSMPNCPEFGMNC